MKTTDYHPDTQQPDMFSRGTLELTFKALRKSRPSLALIIQNLLVEDFTARGGFSMAELPLQPETVKTIIEALSALCNASRPYDIDTDRVLLQSLLLDWSLCFNYLAVGEHRPQHADNDPLGSSLDDTGPDPLGLSAPKH